MCVRALQKLGSGICIRNRKKEQRTEVKERCAKNHKVTRGEFIQIKESWALFDSV